MDKGIRGIQESQLESEKWQDEVSHLTKLDQTDRGKLGKRREKQERKRRRREKLHLFSIISGYRTIDFRRSKRQSSSTGRERRIETRIHFFFDKLYEVGVFLLLGLILI